MTSRALATIATLPQGIRASMRRGAHSLSARELSQVISFSRISLIVGLVFLHYDRYPNVTASPFRGMDPHAFQVATFINSFVLFFFFSVVPLLSMISGWLFFSFETNVARELLNRMKRRFKSLYLPLVLWNLFYLAILGSVFLVDRDARLLHEINLHFSAAGPMDYVNAIFGLTEHPVGFQFWFVRDLFVTILVSPILWMMLRYMPVAGGIILLLVWLSGFNLWIFFRTDVVFFFFVGGLVRMRKVRLEVNAQTTVLLLILYALLVACRTLAPYAIDGAPGILDVATRAMRVVGVIACWGAFQHIALSSTGARIARFGGFAFFLHAAHFPLLAAIKILLWDMVPVETDFWMLLHYVASVVLTVGIGVAAGIALTRVAPTWFAFLNGGRLVG
jgi:hypothetical protein